MNELDKFLLPLGRVLIALIFVLAGWSKLFSYAATQGYMESMGVPGTLLPLVIFTELGFGLAIILGFQVRVAAFALAGFSVLSALLFHLNPVDEMQMTLFLKNLAMAGGLLILVAHGAGSFSVDNWRKNGALLKRAVPQE